MGPGFVFDEPLLLEFSSCAVPMQPDALARSRQTAADLERYRTPPTPRNARSPRADDEKFAQEVMANLERLDRGSFDEQVIRRVREFEFEHANRSPRTARPKRYNS
jgi:hypothetical protein